VQYIDLQSFEDFVMGRKLVAAEHLRYCLHWVLRFLRADFDHDNLSEGDLLPYFCALRFENTKSTFEYSG
jgi:hypothetical protein